MAVNISITMISDPNPCAAYDKEGCQITYLVKCDNITISLLIADRKRKFNAGAPFPVGTLRQDVAPTSI